MEEEVEAEVEANAEVLGSGRSRTRALSSGR